jgi:hypothetical protein
MRKKNLILLLGIVLFLAGLITLIKGELFDMPTNPYPFQRINSPGIIALLIGIFILYFGIKNRNRI